VAAMTLIALVDNFDPLEERLTELESDGKAATGLCSLSGVVWELYINTHTHTHTQNTKFIKLIKDFQTHNTSLLPKHVIITVFTCIFTQWSMCNVPTTI
jgi:hypothetical protein